MHHTVLQIWLYRDKATGMLKGDATVTFDDPFAAASAPSWFDGKTWSDGVSVLHVSLAEKQQDAGYGGGYDRGGRGGYDRGGYGGGGGYDRGGYDRAAPQGPPGKFAPGDWTCTGCGNVNWERRKNCNQCNTPKPGTFDTNREGAGEQLRSAFPRLTAARLLPSTRCLAPHLLAASVAAAVALNNAVQTLKRRWRLQGAG
jgi:hypothetical protein